jgi:hypothetical protein
MFVFNNCSQCNTKRCCKKNICKNNTNCDNLKKNRGVIITVISLFLFLAFLFISFDILTNK